jgi:DNA-binding response OmpR family regulator
VLIVDDCPISRRLIRALLERQIFDILVFELTDGLEVLDYVKTFEVDVVVLDIMLLYKHGDEVLRELEEAQLGVAIVVVSGTYDSNLPFMGSANIKAVFAKPFDPIDFVNAVKSALGLLEDT